MEKSDASIATDLAWRQGRGLLLDIDIHLETLIETNEIIEYPLKDDEAQAYETTDSLLALCVTYEVACSPLGA